MAKPLTDSINALTRYANSVTGQSDTTLSEAVATLADGYGGGDFETGTIIGDNAISKTIPVSKLYTNFIIYWTDPKQTHANGDVILAGGTSSIYFAIAYSDTGTNARINVEYTGTRLKFYDTHIDIQFVANGGYRILHLNANYQWIAW